MLIVYENSLTLAFALLFLTSFALHATTGVLRVQRRSSLRTVSRQSVQIELSRNRPVLVRVVSELAE